jgi:arginase
MDIGQNRRGVDMGPSAIRYAGLAERLRALGYDVSDAGNLPIPTPSPHDAALANAHHAAGVAQIAHAAAAAMQACVSAGEIGVFLGGDHSCALGTVAGSLARPGRTGVLWVDAHADFNTPTTSPSGNVHGMVVASLMGLCPPPLQIGTARLQAADIVMLGIRDLDREERAALRASGITVYTMSDIDELGIAAVMRRVIAHFANHDHLHVSFDMDSLDPTIAPGVGTPVSGGLSIREAHLVMELLHSDGRVCALDVVEVNPILDLYNRTAELAVDLTASLFGQRIL